MANQVFEDIRQKIRNGSPITRLIIINVAVFLLFGICVIFYFFSGALFPQESAKQLFSEYLALPMNFRGFLHQPWTLITYMFTQEGIGHLFWNMITLYWFGAILSEYSSPRKIAPLYILGGLAGALISITFVSLVPAFNYGSGSYLIGASGGITAIVVAAATLVPNYRMNLLFIGPVKLLYVALFVLFIDVLDVASYSNVGGNLAHLGGALMGYVFILQYKKGNDWARPINSFFDWTSNLASGSRKGKMKVVSRKKMSDEEYNYLKAVNQQTVDAILDKISRSGYESLSKTEKDILFKASKK
jgi:membrane associated rhomboid family serine protease